MREAKDVERAEMQPKIEEAICNAFDQMDAPLTHDHARRLQRSLLRIAARITFGPLDQGDSSFVSAAGAMFNEEHSCGNAVLPSEELGVKATPETLKTLAFSGSPEEHMSSIESVWSSFKGFFDNQVLPLFPKGKPVTEAHYDTARQDMALLEGHLKALKKGKEK